LPPALTPTPTIAQVRTEVLRYRLPKPVGGSAVAVVDVLVTDLELDGGASGMGFSYVIGGGADAALAAARSLGDKQLTGQPLHHPESTWLRLAASLNRTRRGPNFLALAALDVAVWDAYARTLGVPLGIAMGGAPRGLRVYGSGTFTGTQSPGEAAATARAHVARQLAGVKPRVNGKRSDEALIRAVVEAVPAHIDVMVDANEKCTATSAQRLLAVAREHGVLFVEEPLPADDVTGHRSLARAFPRLVASGEHLQGTAEMLPFIAEGLLGLAQPDLAMVGGLTETLRIARLAQAFGIEVSPHFLPGLFVHVAAAAPNVTWLEEFPLIEPVFAGWPTMADDGTLAMRNVPGHGLTLAEGAREQLRFVP
jgi:L-alanine-DL-glutamate epimerase-like enolase superfamily enzyme